jgi:hypothetical protein
MEKEEEKIDLNSVTIPPKPKKPELPPKQTAKRNAKKAKEPEVSKQNFNTYNLSLVAPITVEKNPVLVVCKTNAPKGSYFIQNKNDILLRQRMRVEAGFAIVDSGRVEVVLTNIDPFNPIKLKLDEGFVVGKLLKV